MMKLLSLATKSPYFYIAIFGLLVSYHTFYYLKVVQDEKMKNLKINAERGIKNNEILSNRPNDIIDILRANKF